MMNGDRNYTCCYNPGIECFALKCSSKCGWKPGEAARRSHSLRVAESWEQTSDGLLRLHIRRDADGRG